MCELEKLLFGFVCCYRVCAIFLMNSWREPIYDDGRYLENNPSWHLEDSPFKAKYISQLLRRNGVAPRSLAEVGCGIGEILALLCEQLGEDCVGRGFDISSVAIETARSRKRLERVSFADVSVEEISERFDVAIAADVFEHIPDYMRFLKDLKGVADFKVLHIPLDVHVSSVVRGSVSSAYGSVGHLHYFTEDSALTVLRHCGYEIVDSMLTPGAIELAKFHPSWKRSLGNVPRRFVGLLSQRLASRLFGGYSLLVLAK